MPVEAGKPKGLVAAKTFVKCLNQREADLDLEVLDGLPRGVESPKSAPDEPPQPADANCMLVASEVS